MGTRSVVLTARQEALVESLVQSGRFETASDVVREGLRLVEDREREGTTQLETLRAASQIGIDALERGEHRDFGDAASLIAYLNAVDDTVSSEPGEA